LKRESESSRAQGFSVLISHNYNISLDAILGRILQLQLHSYSYRLISRVSLPFYFLLSLIFVEWRRTARASNSELLGSKIFLVSFILSREFIVIPEMETHPRLST
jgi:hypothetical protein